jgi:hypothetical protein
MNKPRLIVYTTMSGQFSKKDAERMADAGAMLAFHVGPSEPKAIDYFMTYNIPDELRIWISTAFDKSDTLESITQPVAFSNLMYRRKIPLASVPGLIGIDFEPTGESLKRYKQEPLPMWAYLNLRRQTRDFAESWDFVLPVDGRYSSLYNVFRGVGVWGISEDSYFKSIEMATVMTLRLAGRIPIDCILGRMASADGKGYNGRAARFTDAMTGYLSEKILFIYATGGDFGTIAKDITDWMGKP